MLVNQTVETLRRMRLIGMAEAFLAQGQDPGCRELSFEERFGLLVDQESTYREDRRLKRLLRGAHLKTQACVEDIDYSHSRGLDRAAMASLSSCQWVRDHRNVLVTGYRRWQDIHLLRAGQPCVPQRLWFPLLSPAQALHRPRHRPRRWFLPFVHAETGQERRTHPGRLGSRAAHRGREPRTPRSAGGQVPVKVHRGGEPGPSGEVVRTHAGLHRG